MDVLSTFHQAVQEKFAFLQGFGFGDPNVLGNRVRFRSDRFVIEVVWNTEWDGEVFVAGGTAEGQVLPLLLYLRHKVPTLMRAVGDGVADDASEAVHKVEAWANALREGGGPLLEASPTELALLEQLRWWTTGAKSEGPA